MTACMLYKFQPVKQNYAKCIHTHLIVSLCLLCKRVSLPNLSKNTSDSNLAPIFKPITNNTDYIHNVQM